MNNSTEGEVSRAIERVTNITWDLDYHDERSYVELMYEYLRRMALWVDTPSVGS